MTRISPGRLTLAAFAVAATAFAGVGSAANEDQVLLCHGTASEPNPYSLISVDSSALNGHLNGSLPGHGPNNNADVAPVNGACPTVPPDDGGGGE